MLDTLKKNSISLKIAFILCFFSNNIFAQVALGDQANLAFLKQNAIMLEKESNSARVTAFSLAKEKGWQTFGITKDGNVFTLYGVDDFGMPLYRITENNTISAATINTNKLYTGGALGLNLSGSTLPSGKVALWDGGAVLANHVEFPNQKIEIKDGTNSTSAHSTHVAGTIAAIGNYSNAKGMAFGLPKLWSYDFNNDNAEMSSAATSLLLSNHSYGPIAGWYENTGVSPNRWEFRGQAGTNEDYKFGYYDNDAKEWDRICYNAPYYLPVKSGGNYRSSNGPAVGENYYRFNATGSIVNAGARPVGMYSNDGYDILGTYAVAKNILTVAAVNPLPYGTVTPADVSISSFSAWGPTDDGRIKPDIAADGVNVTSTSNAGPNAYTTLSGTSMSAPSVTGSLVLLQELYHQKTGNFMRAATLKALTLGTASEAGQYPGPDYIFGWGLMNTESAAKAILDNGNKSSITEFTLAEGSNHNINVIASGNGPLIATICWTDPEIDVIPVVNALDNNTLRLVNDLDTRVSDGSTTHLPWVLNPTNPAAAATKGDNFRDNAEQIFIADAVPGKTYTINISHKGTLKNGTQPFSVVVTGVGGSAYCNSAPLSANDSKITNFKLSNVDVTNASNCTAYTNLTNETILLEKAKSYPLSISLGTCGTNFNKIAKVFIDWNGDGDFEEANELAATSSIISGNGIFTANITVPSTVITNNFSLLRVVLAETSDAATVGSCGTYTKGETQDYRVKFLSPAADVGISTILDPIKNCATPQQTVTVVIRNFGTETISDIPITAVVKEAATTVATLNGIYTYAIKPGEEVLYQLPGFYAAESGKTYLITAKTNLNIDYLGANDEATKSILVNLPVEIANSSSAYYCDDSKKYLLSASGNGTVFWYSSESSTTPIAYGNETYTSAAPTDNKFYAAVNEYSSSVGPKNKYESQLGSGTYLQTSGAVYVRTTAPLILESARLYIGNSGTINFSVVNDNGVEVSSSSIKVTATRSNPAPGVTANDLSDQGQVYTLNLKFPEAGNYTIRVSYQDGATIFRNNSVSSAIYPLNAALNIFTITGNNAETPSAFYYYFYDVTLKALDCASARRVATTVTPITITRNGDELTSNLNTGNQWYLNGEKIDGATTKIYKPLKPGKYYVTASLASGCMALAEEIAFLTPNPAADNEIKLRIFPVPATTEMTIAFEINETQELVVELTNILGQKVYTEKKTQVAGVYINNLDVSYFTQGTYLLNIKIGNKSYVNKVVIL